MDLFIGLAIGILFTWLPMKTLLDFERESSDHWFKTAKKYMHMLLENEKDKKESRPDPADWWKSSN